MHTAYDFFSPFISFCTLQPVVDSYTWSMHGFDDDEQCSSHILQLYSQLVTVIVAKLVLLIHKASHHLIHPFPAWAVHLEKRLFLLLGSKDFVWKLETVH